MIAYVNTDMYMKGRFDAGGVPSLREFVTEVARDLPGTITQTPDEQSLPWKSLGSGADFVPFQDHLGVPSLSIEFIGANGYGFGTYHSNYDSRAYVEQVADPGFEQGVAMVRVLGTLALRMSNADILPFRFADYAERLRQAVGQLGGPSTRPGSPWMSTPGSHASRRSRPPPPSSNPPSIGDWHPAAPRLRSAQRSAGPPGTEARR